MEFEFKVELWNDDGEVLAVERKTIWVKESDDHESDRDIAGDYIDEWAVSKQIELDADDYEVTLVNVG